MKTAIFGLFAIALLLMSLVPAALADSNETFDAAKALIAQEVPCSDLTQDQLEQLGDYYMEQMHPGAAHERMDAMMGGEGSESLRQMHINMAKRFYCGDTTVSGCPMMGGGMMGGYGDGMMGGYGNGMMGNYQSGSTMMGGLSSWNVINSVLFTLLLAALIVLVVFGIVRLSKR